jgi:hypothetical protein
MQRERMPILLLYRVIHTEDRPGGRRDNNGGKRIAAASEKVPIIDISLPKFGKPMTR